MFAGNEIERKDRRWVAILKLFAQVGSGLASGWVAGLAVFTVGLVGLSVLGFRTTIRDVLCVVAMIVWLMAVWVGTVAAYRFRRTWLPLVAAFAVSTSVVSMFVIVVVIPFAAGMRDFD